MRERIKEILSSDNIFNLVGEAKDGQEAITKTQELKPDILILDIVMPNLNGLEVTKIIMANFPTKILILSSANNRSDSFQILDALKLGAVEVLEKGELQRDGVWEERFRKLLKIISRVSVIKRHYSELPICQSFTTQNFSQKGKFDLFACGASTGGPSAVVKVLNSLDENFSLPKFVVIHFEKAFGKGLVEWLNSNTKFNVRFIKNRERIDLIRPDEVIMPAPGMHMKLNDKMVCSVDGPEVNYSKPSIDVLFESIARETTLKPIACLLTGMGRDGANGLQKIKEHGGLTIIQDEKTSVVWGMPKKAFEIGAHNYILPIDEIGRFVSEKSFEHKAGDKR